MIPYGRHYIDEADVAAVVDVLRHGSLTQGPKVAEFEEAVARHVGAKYAVAVSSGTAALHLACLAADVGSGDNIITSPNTFVASANCALYVGATPQFADIDPEMLNLDAGALARKCAELKIVKAIVPVHFAGLPCDMPAIREIATLHRAIVIEDASHALGAVYGDGGRVGNCRYSDMTVFSFHPVKVIAAGEGGMVTTNSEELYRRLLRLRSHGINKGDDRFLILENAGQDGVANRWYYEMQELGYNYRLTDIQAALAVSQMRKLPAFLKRRRELTDEYDHAFQEHPHIRPTQTNRRDASSHHLYVVRIPFNRLKTSRGRLMQQLFEAGIITQVHYIPVPLHPYYQNRGYRIGSTPQAERYYQEALSLPLYVGLTCDQQQFVVETLQRFLQ